MISTLHDIALLQCLNTIVQDQEAIEQRKAQIAQLIHPQDLQLYYQIALQGRTDLALSLTPEQGFEMCVMRLLAFRPIAANEVVVHTTQVNTLQVEAQKAHVSISQPVEMHQAEHEQHTIVDEQINTSSVERVEQVDDLSEASSSVMQPQIEADEPADLANFHDVDFENQIQDIQIQDNQDVPHLDVSMPQDIPEHATADFNDQNVMLTDDDLFDEPHAVEDRPSVVEPAHVEPQVERIEPQNIEIDDPRDLLIPAEEELTGQWTLKKWDYWLRLNHLSPAVKEIAQHGVMQGEIAGESQLTLDPSYQRMFESFVTDVENALTELNPVLKLTIQYATVEQDSPYELQLQRKRDAYAMAQQKIETHPVVNQVIQEFDATIKDFNLKLDD